MQNGAADLDTAEASFFGYLLHAGHLWVLHNVLSTKPASYLEFTPFPGNQ